MLEGRSPKGDGLLFAFVWWTEWVLFFHNEPRSRLYLSLKFISHLKCCTNSKSSNCKYFYLP